MASFISRYLQLKNVVFTFFCEKISFRGVALVYFIITLNSIQKNCSVFFLIFLFYNNQEGAIVFCGMNFLTVSALPSSQRFSYLDFQLVNEFD